MATRIKRFSILQTGKVLAVLYGFISVILFPIVLIVALFSPKGSIALIPLVVIYPILGFIGGVLGAAFYNLAARFVGGLEVTLEQTEG
jgi:hypothetical protein